MEQGRKPRNKFTQGDKLYTEKYKTPMKEIKDDMNRWRDILHSWVGRVSVVEMTILPGAITGLTRSLSNHQWHLSQN